MRLLIFLIFFSCSLLFAAANDDSDQLVHGQLALECRTYVNVALDERALPELKALAAHQGILYQILMRVFILRGIESMKQAS